MPRRQKLPTKAASTPEPELPKELLDRLVKGPMTQGDLESMFRSLKKAVIERAMSGEMTEHLGYRQGESKPEGQTNRRNTTNAIESLHMQLWKIIKSRGHFPSDEAATSSCGSPFATSWAAEYDRHVNGKVR